MEKDKQVLKGDLQIGKRIKEMRKKRDLTQRKLAELVMVSPSCITRLEAGEAMVSVFTMIQIAKVLNVSVTYILEGITEDFKDSELLGIASKLKLCTAEQRKMLICGFEEIVEAFF